MLRTDCRQAVGGAGERVAIVARGEIGIVRHLEQIDGARLRDVFESNGADVVIVFGYVNGKGLDLVGEAEAGRREQLNDEIVRRFRIAHDGA